MTNKAVWLLMLLGSNSAFSTDYYRWIDKTGAVNYGDQAPSGPVIKIERIKLGSNVIDGQDSYVVKIATSKNPVILFSGDCGPLCANAKSLLDKRGVPYTLKDPQKNKTDAEALNELTGAMEIPAIKIGKEVIKGYQPAQWNSKLDVAGYPKIILPALRKLETQLPSEIN